MTAAPASARTAKLAAAAFGLLVVATFAAFFVAQRLKHAPSVIQDLGLNTNASGYRGVFSPNGDGRRDRVRVGLMLKEADHVTLTVVDPDGDTVRTLVDDQPIAAYKRLWGVPWDGTDADGRPVPDGRYKIRITLRDQGRSVIYPTSIVKDTTPPRPRVRSVGPLKAYGPELWPNPQGAPVTAHFDAAPRFRPQVMVFRTGPGRVRQVAAADLRPGDRAWTWDPTGAAPGTYVIALQWRDPAGNIGTSIPLGRDGLPRLGADGWSPRGGVTVRYVGARPPVLPAKARDDVTLRVDSAEPYRWSIRPLGGRPVARGGPKRGDAVTTGAPGGKSRVYLFEARTPGHVTAVPFAVQARQPVAGTVEDPRGVLVLLPTMTWQGRNPVDDDGDGRPNLLDLGETARIYRDFAGGGLPVGFGALEAPVLGWMDRTGRRFDLTTDVALAAGRGQPLGGHRGVLIPGDARWLPSSVRAQLRAFVRGGGTVVSLGTDSLRRTVTVDAVRLSQPSRRRSADLFGARLRDVVHEPTTLTVFKDDPATRLFEGGEGSFAGIDAYEDTISLGPDATLLSNAVTEQPLNRTVIVAARYGKGRIIRTGLPGFGRLLATDDDPAIGALMARMWTLLSR